MDDDAEELTSAEETWPRYFNRPPADESADLSLNRRYTFDTFIIGASNRFAHAAALAIAGAADMISVQVRQSLIQLATPEFMLGRVAAVSFIFISASNELGDFEAGVMGAIFGPALGVAIGGGAALVASILWIRLFPQLANADTFEDKALEESREATPAEVEAKA